MPKFPEPPPADELAALGPIIHVLPRDSELWRVYCRGGPHPTAWHTMRSYGPTDSRFDHQLPPRRNQDRKILYAARAIPTAIAEVFQATRVIDRQAREPWLVGFSLTREVQLLNLTGVWPTRAGASMAINTGPRSRARRWSQRIYEAFPQIEGLLYASSMHANHPAVALYERAEPALPTQPIFNRPLQDPALLAALQRVGRALNYTLV